MIKNLFYALSLLVLLSGQLPAEDKIKEKAIEFTDIDPSKKEDVKTLANARVMDSDLHEAMTTFSNNADPKKSFEQTIQHQNQEYISSLGFHN
jgi:hypothetical protein